MRISPLHRRSFSPPRRRGRHSGQSVVEFALVLPILLLMIVGVGDFGRLYTSAVAVESAAREAADFGAFESTNWAPANVSVTTAAMQRRACVAAMGSHLEGYVGATDGTTCTNPSFSCNLEWSGTSVPCDTSGGFVGTTDCATHVTEPPCTVHVRLVYDFDMFLDFPGLPGTLQLDRESRFRMQDLTP